MTPEEKQGVLKLIDILEKRIIEMEKLLEKSLININERLKLLEHKAPMA